MRPGKGLAAAAAALALAACGGTKKDAEGPGATGADDAASMSAWGGGAPDANASGLEDTGKPGGGTTRPDQPGGGPGKPGGKPDLPAGTGAPGAPGVGPATPASPFTFALENAGDDDLVFAIDKGWQPVLFAYTGKPPKARSILLFPTACTESCDIDPDEMCPVCRESSDPKTRKREEKEETRRETAAAGAKVSVPWDGKVFVYEKAPPEAGRKKCQCWRKVDPPPDTYTIKACGLRPAKRAGSASRAVCAEAAVTLPATDPTITLSFGK